SCTLERDWSELACLCFCGNNCAETWTCHCNDQNLKPPGCTTRHCCSGFWGECNAGMHGQGPGGGVCQNNGVCQCYDDYDPRQCCGYRKPGATAPAGFGNPCYGVSTKTIDVTCIADEHLACGSCPARTMSATFPPFNLQPDGGGKFHDQYFNVYRL